MYERGKERKEGRINKKEISKLRKKKRKKGRKEGREF